MPNLGTCEVHLFPFCEHLVAADTSGTGWVVVLPSCLQDSATDVSVTSLTFDAKLSMVVRFAVGYTILADVLPGQDDTAGLTFEAAHMPLFVQSQERLAMLDFFLAPSTVAWSTNLDWFTARHGLGARLTHTFLPTEGHFVSNGERLPA